MEKIQCEETKKLIDEIMSLTSEERKQLLEWWKNNRVTQPLT